MSDKMSEVQSSAKSETAAKIVSESEAAKKAVLAVWPNATVMPSMTGEKSIWTTHDLETAKPLNISVVPERAQMAFFLTEDCAWLDAASKLAPLTEDAPKVTKCSCGHTRDRHDLLVRGKYLYCADCKTCNGYDRAPASPVGELEGAFEAWWNVYALTLGAHEDSQLDARSAWNAALSSKPAPKGIPERPQWGKLGSGVEAHLSKLEAIISAKDAENSALKVEHGQIIERLHLEFEDGMWFAPAEPNPVESESFSGIVELVCNLTDLDLVARAEEAESLVATRDAEIAAGRSKYNDYRKSMSDELGMGHDRAEAAERELASLRASSEAKDFDIRLLLECMKGIRASFGLPPHEVMDVLAAMLVPAEVEHNLRASSAKVREEALRESAQIGMACDLPRAPEGSNQNAFNAALREYQNRILSLLPTSPESQEAGQ